MQLRDRERLDGDYERVTVVPDTVDDIWHLQYVIEPGDRVAGDTHRRIQRADDQARDTGGSREHMWIAIAVESVEFHKFANRLRIGGEIVACSREDQIGFHHTINVEPRDEISLQKRFKPDQWERLEDAAAASEDPDIAIVTVEEGLATIHAVAQSGPERTAELSGTTGKGDYADDRDALFDELAAAMGRLDVETIILAGPGFTKQDVYDHLADSYPDIADRIRTVDTSSAGDRGVQEVLERGAIEDVRAAERVGREASYVAELMERIATDGAASYGPDNVETAADYGAIDTLLIVDERLRRERGDAGEWSIDADALLRTVDQQGGEVIVVSSEHDPGQQLQNLGGIGALLRYRIE